MKKYERKKHRLCASLYYRQETGDGLKKDTVSDGCQLSLAFFLPLCLSSGEDHTERSGQIVTVYQGTSWRRRGFVQWTLKALGGPGGGPQYWWQCRGSGATAGERERAYVSGPYSTRGGWKCWGISSHQSYLYSDLHVTRRQSYG